MKRRNEIEQSQAKYINKINRCTYTKEQQKRKITTEFLKSILSQYKRFKQSVLKSTSREFYLIMILLMSFLAVPPNFVYCESPNIGINITKSSLTLNKIIIGNLTISPYDKFAEKITNALIKINFIKNDSIINDAQQYNVLVENYADQNHDHIDSKSYSEANKVVNLLHNVSDNKISQFSDNNWLVQHTYDVNHRLNENEYLITMKTKRPNIKTKHKRMITNTQMNSTILENFNDDNMNSGGNYINNESLLHFVMDGLGLTKLPDMNKVNISQLEYATKYREYINRIQQRYQFEFESNELSYKKYHFEPLHFVSIVTNVTQMKKYTHRNDLYQRTRRQAQIQLSNIAKRQQTHPSKLKKQYQTRIPLQFPLNVNVSRLHPNNIEEANVRLMLIQNPLLAFRSMKKKSKKELKCNRSYQSISQNKVPHVLNLKIIHQQKHRKHILLDAHRIEIPRGKTHDTFSKWLQFDVTSAVSIWLNDQPQTELLELLLVCDKCQRIGARILNDAYDEKSHYSSEDSTIHDRELMPVLNIIGHFINEERTKENVHKIYNSLKSEIQNKNENSSIRHQYHHNVVNSRQKTPMSDYALHRNNCFKSNQRCCRHSLEVVFKEIRGFEFIIQPKLFDAGYCQGRCPPRYNPANHHAMLQGLIWQQNRRKAPQPCCAPSKLVELEILHVDETDSEKLKISTWTDMRVVECACS